MVLALLTAIDARWYYNLNGHLVAWVVPSDSKLTVDHAIASTQGTANSTPTSVPGASLPGSHTRHRNYISLLWEY